jgi:PAS domain S-box-containing protein
MNLRFKTALPVALVALAILTYLLWIALQDVLPATQAARLIPVVGAGLVLLVIAAAVSVELAVTRPLASLATTMRTLLNRPHDAGVDGSSDPMAQLGAATRALKAQIAAQNSELQKSADQRQQLEAALRLSEQRYTLAVRSANDGMWEWNLQTDQMYFSPRWKSMLGFGEDEMGERREDWRRCVATEDLPAAEAAVAAHLEGRTERYEHQHRVLHKNGEPRWILSRGAALHHASGKPYRMVGLDTDITAIRRIETILQEIAQGTAGDCGDAFFRSLVRHFARALHLPCAFITECADYPTSRLRTLAFWSDGRFHDNFEYDLPGTPCEAVVKSGSTCFHPNNVDVDFPREEGYEGYVGVPIIGSGGRVIGHLAFLDRKPMGEEVLVDAIFRIFTARAAAELERKQLQARVLGLVQTLTAVRGEACFQTLAKAFTEVMGVREAIVTECMDKPHKRLHVLAWWRDGRIEPEVTYDLKGSTCEETINDGRICFYPSGVGERFPPARPFDRESYLGVPCLDSAGKVIGHVACFDNKAIARELPEEAILKLFADRAAVEIERQRLAQAEQQAQSRIA